MHHEEWGCICWIIHIWFVKGKESAIFPNKSEHVKHVVTGVAERNRESEHVKHISPVETCWQKRKLQKLYPTFLHVCYRSPAQTGNEACWRYNRHYGVRDECVEKGKRTHLTHPHHEKNPHTSWFHQHNCHGILNSAIEHDGINSSEEETCLLLLHFQNQCSLALCKTTTLHHSTRTQPEGPERERKDLCTKLMFNHSQICRILAQRPVFHVQNTLGILLNNDCRAWESLRRVEL